MADDPVVSGEDVPVADPAGRDRYRPRPELRGQTLGEVALSLRLTRGARPRLIVLAVVAPILGASAGLALRLMDSPPWLASIAGALLFFILVAFLPNMVLRRSDRKLAYLLGVSVYDTEVRWVAAFPLTPMPFTPKDIAEWLSTSAPLEADQDALTLEVSGLIRLGRHEEARIRLDRLTPEPGMRSFIRASLKAKLEFNAGGPGPLAETVRLMDSLTGSDREVAADEVALEEGGRAVVLGRDWGPPIAAACRAIGGAGFAYYVGLGAGRLRRYAGRIGFGMVAVAAVVTYAPIGA